MLNKIAYTVRSFFYILKGNNLIFFNNKNKLKNSARAPLIRILGNGESLKNAINSFGNESDVDYMVVNRHVLSENFLVLKPRYYVIADPYFFEKDEGLNVLENINNKLNWEMYLLVPSSKKNRTVINEIFGGNKFIEPFFFNSVSFKGFQSVKYFLYSHNLSMPRPQNVLVAGIYCAILAKFKRIELFGAEHSWIKYLSVNDVCEVCIEDRHFYDKEKVTRQTWNSTHDGDTKLHVILRAFAYMFESYWELQKFSEQQNVEIVNYSKESFIDAFKKNLN